MCDIQLINLPILRRNPAALSAHLFLSRRVCLVRLKSGGKYSADHFSGDHTCDICIFQQIFLNFICEIELPT